MLTAREVMRRRVETLSPEMTLREAADLLIDRRISGAPVVDAEGRLVGVLSHRDYVAAERDELRGRAPAFYRDGERLEVAQPDGAAAQRKVKEVMTRDVIAAPEEASVVELARLMSDRRIHRVVVTRGSRLVGIVSSLDILRALADAFQTGFPPPPARRGRPARRARAAASGRKP